VKGLNESCWRSTSSQQAPLPSGIGAVVAIITAGCLFQNEINKFFWWPLHLAGWLLALSFIPLFIGAAMLSREHVKLTVLPAWIPLTLAGIVVLLCTFRSRDRIDR
jgi:hypothetical protein